MDKMIVQCLDCDGTGSVESEVLKCSQPKSNCCGSCYEIVEEDCEVCDGHGDYDALEVRDKEFHDLLEAMQKIKDLEDLEVLEEFIRVSKENLD